MVLTPKPDESARLATSSLPQLSVRDSQIRRATVAQRSARRLLSDQLGLRAGQRLLLLLSHAEGLEAAQGLFDKASHELGVALSVLDTRTLDLASEAERRAWQEALGHSHACVLLGGEGRPAADRFESEVRAHTGGRPFATLRFDPDALLADGLLAPSVLQRAYGRYLLSRLVGGARVSVGWHGAPPLELTLAPARTVPRSRATSDGVDYPRGHVAVPIATADGHLARPTSVLLPRAGAGTITPHGFQFHRGMLRAVTGGDGAAWLGEVSRRFPGLRLKSLGFGLVSPSPSALDRAGVRLSDVGCTLSVVDARQRGVSDSHAAHTGLTFCLNGAGLDVHVDGLPVMRGGEFVEPATPR